MMTFARVFWVCIGDPCPTFQCLVHVLFHSCDSHSFWWVFVNIATMFCSEEYPLFLLRQGWHGTSVDGNSELCKSVGSNFGLSSWRTQGLTILEAGALWWTTEELQAVHKTPTQVCNWVLRFCRGVWAAFVHMALDCCLRLFHQICQHLMPLQSSFCISHPKRLE